MRRFIAFAFVVGVPWIASADKNDNEKKAAEEEGGEDASDEDEKPESAAKPEEPKKPAKQFKKQNLTGHAEDNKPGNAFEKDRFFVDKVDTEESAKKTLIQGSLASNSFFYREAGGTIAGNGAVPSNSPLTRLFTELRLQTDFRHIGGGNWDSRVDVRGRFVADPSPITDGYTPATNSSSQSGFLGENELDVKELWITRNGKRTDLTFGRQFVADLGAVKFDGLRFDYASSTKFTLFGFGGLYPIRGSRSITTDYEPLKSSTLDAGGMRASAGRFTGTGGFGAAYRTDVMYGAFGGVAIAPLSSEAPRVYGTATGYWRAGPKIDLYHFAILDLLGDQAGLTNLSAGANFKPDQRLRATLSFNRVDTETLNVQAQAFLNDPQTNVNVVQNESFIARIAQNTARASLSAGLGSLQRFELTVAASLRYRGEVTLQAPVAMNPQVITLAPGKSVEIYGSFVDRRSFKNLRIGIDASRLFKVGDISFARTTSLAIRASASREMADGRGEWEGEVAYTTTKDDAAGVTCEAGNLASCFGAANSSMVSLGGNVFYRLNASWLAIGSLFINVTNITHVEAMTATADPGVYSVTGFGRIAYRF